MFNLSLSAEKKTALFACIRQFFYLSAIMLFVFGINVTASVYNGETFEEHGIIENLQFFLLVACSVIFLLSSYIKKDKREIFLLLASVSIFASIRECDMFFDENLPVISWKFAWIFPISAFVYAIKHFERTRDQVFEFIASPAFNMMIAAVIVVIPIAQCIGHRSLVVNVLGNRDVGQIKEFFEECVETIGYFVLFLSAIESFWSFSKK